MGKLVIVASRRELLGLDAIYGLSAFLNTVPESRRRVLDWLAEVIFGWLEEGGVILDADGNEIVIDADTIDLAHGDDGSARWVSDIRGRTANPPQRRPKSSLYLRLALYDSAARISTGRSIVGFGEGGDSGAPRCPGCGRLIQKFPREREQWCKVCLDPSGL